MGNKINRSESSLPLQNFVESPQTSRWGKFKVQVCMLIPGMNTYRIVKHFSKLCSSAESTHIHPSLSQRAVENLKAYSKTGVYSKGEAIVMALPVIGNAIIFWKMVHDKPNQQLVEESDNSETTNNQKNVETPEEENALATPQIEDEAPVPPSELAKEPSEQEAISEQLLAQAPQPFKPPSKLNQLKKIFSNEKSANKNEPLDSLQKKLLEEISKKKLSIEEPLANIKDIIVEINGINSEINEIENRLTTESGLNAASLSADLLEVIMANEKIGVKNDFYEALKEAFSNEKIDNEELKEINKALDENDEKKISFFMEKYPEVLKNIIPNLHHETILEIKEKYSLQNILQKSANISAVMTRELEQFGYNFNDLTQNPEKKAENEFGNLYKAFEENYKKIEISYKEIEKKYAKIEFIAEQNKKNLPEYLQKEILEFRDIMNKKEELMQRIEKNMTHFKRGEGKTIFFEKFFDETVVSFFKYLHSSELNQVIQSKIVSEKLNDKKYENKSLIYDLLRNKKYSGDPIESYKSIADSKTFDGLKESIKEIADNINMLQEDIYEKTEKLIEEIDNSEKGDVKFLDKTLSFLDTEDIDQLESILDNKFKLLDKDKETESIINRKIEINTKKIKILDKRLELLDKNKDLNMIELINKKKNNTLEERISLLNKKLEILDDAYDSLEESKNNLTRLIELASTKNFFKKTQKLGSPSPLPSGIQKLTDNANDKEIRNNNTEISAILSKLNPFLEDYHEKMKKMTFHASLDKFEKRMLGPLIQRQIEIQKKMSNEYSAKEADELSAALGSAVKTEETPEQEELTKENEFIENVYKDGITSIRNKLETMEDELPDNFLTEEEINNLFKEMQVIDTEYLTQFIKKRYEENNPLYWPSKETPILSQPLSAPSKKGGLLSKIGKNKKT